MARYRPGVDKSGNWWLKIVLKICVDTPIVDTNKIDKIEIQNRERPKWSVAIT